MDVAITIDLDDTILMTQDDFESAREWFAEYVSDKYDVSYEEAKETQSEKSRELISRYGLSIKRFPTACVEALHDLVNDPRETDLDRVFEIGRSAFKENYQYSRRGFREGSFSLIQTSKELSDKLILLTTGDERLQNRKIEALDLEEIFDEIYICQIGGKSEVLKNLDAEFDRVLHIGNSESSDVEAASEAGVECMYIPEGEWRTDENKSLSDKNDVIFVESMTDSETKLREIFD